MPFDPARPEPDSLSLAPYPGKTGGDLGKLGRHPGKVGSYLGNIPAHLWKVGPHLGNIPAHPWKVGAHLGDIPAHLSKVGSHLGNIPAHLWKVGAHLGDIPAHLSKVGSHLGNIPAHLGMVTAHFWKVGGYFGGLTPLFLRPAREPQLYHGCLKRVFTYIADKIKKEFDAVKLAFDLGTVGLKTEIDLRPHYILNWLPVPGQSAVFKVRARYLYKGEEFGNWSEWHTWTLTGA